MHIWSRALGMFATNCYIVACSQTREAAVVDPGEPDPWIQQVLTDQGLTVTHILLTHGHLDHIGGVAQVRSLTGAPVCIHAADAPMLTDPVLNGSRYFGASITAPAPDRKLQDGDVVAVGRLRLEVIFTPGHTPGGVCFYKAPEGDEVGHLLAGDTLFAGSIGRTDLLGGSAERLITSIRTRLLPLPPETVVYPGHGPTTTIGDEREYNPFL